MCTQMTSNNLKAHNLQGITAISDLIKIEGEILKQNQILIQTQDNKLNDSLGIVNCFVIVFSVYEFLQCERLKFDCSASITVKSKT